MFVERAEVEVLGLQIRSSFIPSVRDYHQSSAAGKGKDAHDPIVDLEAPQRPEEDPTCDAVDLSA